MHDMGTARRGKTTLARSRHPPSGPTLPQWRRTLGLVVGAALIVLALGVLLAYVRRAGLDAWAGYFLGVAALTALLLLSGQAQQPPRWRPIRILLALVTTADVLVLTLWIWIAGAPDDQASRLQTVNWCLAVAAPFALMSGLPRRRRCGVDNVRMPVRGRGA